MIKPDDIDQDAWEKAWGIVSDIQMKDIKDGLPAGWEVFASIDRIARAIMSAKAEEREANVAELQSVADDPPSHDPGVCLDMAIRAIRNRP